MPNLIQEINESLNDTPPLKVDIKPAFTPPETPPMEVPPIPVNTPQIPQPNLPVEQPLEAPPTTVDIVPPPTGLEALSFGSTVSRMSAESAQSIQKVIESSETPKPNEVQKQLLGNNNPVQIDPKLSSQNNPFITGNAPRNAEERLAFQPSVLPNGLRNPFSDSNAIAAVQAGISEGEYLAYKRALDDYNRSSNPSPLINLGLQDSLNSSTRKPRENFTGLNADEIRAKMRLVAGYNEMSRSFNRNFLPFLGEDRSSLDTLFGLLSLPANTVKGAALDLTRPVAALISGGFNVEEIKKAYEAMRPTRGGSFIGAAALGEQFQSMEVVGSTSQFNPFAVVRDDKSIPQALAGFGLDVLLDPLNIPAVESRLFGLFSRSKVVPPSTSIIPEVLPPVQSALPPSNIAGVLPEARTIDVTGRVIITPPNPVQSNRVIVPPTRQGRGLPYTPDRLMLEGSLGTPVQMFPRRTGNEGVARVPLPELRVPEPVKPEGFALPKLEIQPDKPAPLPDLSAIEYKRAEPEVGASYESLARYEPSEVVFPVARQPFTPSLDAGGAIVKVEPADIQLYNNVTALFNDSPQLPVIQQAVREVVEQRPVTVELPRNPVLQEVIEYGRTGELTPNIAVLKGATPDEVRAIVNDKLEVMRETSFVVPRLEVQPVELPKLEFDITRPSTSTTSSCCNSFRYCEDTELRFYFYT
jgi:hypothetical protein